MADLKDIFDSNRRWASERVARDPDFFRLKNREQRPKYLWIGCADSRVMANEITGLDAGQLFVHRNIANQVIHTDLNCLSVLQFGIEYLKVEEIIVCGHYGCGGVQAAMSPFNGLADNWLRHIRDTYWSRQQELSALESEKARFDRLVELNLAKQVLNTAATTVVQQAWKCGQHVHIHGLVYSLEDGLLRELGKPIEGPEDLDALYRL